jgi:uncharacterized protein HemX
MSETKARATDTDLVMTALDTIQSVQEEQTLLLVNLEARPVVDVTGIERRLEELADAVERLRPPPRRRRPWWLTSLLLTLVFLVGFGVGWVQMRWVTHPVAAPPIAAPKKGK